MSRTDFDHLSLRGTGRTTKQMQDAPKGAIYVWVNQHLGWPRDLAHHLGCDDLQIVSPTWLERMGNWAGRSITGLVLDHAAELSDRQYAGYRVLLTRVR